MVNRIYDGAVDVLAWPGILRDVAEFLGAPRALILTLLHPVEAGGFVIPHAIEQSFLEQWSTRYQADDIWTQAIVEKNLLREGNSILAEDMVPRAELLASRWYREFLSQMDIADVLTNIVFGPDSGTSLPTAISFYRGLRDPRYGESDRKTMQLLMPHLSRALGVMYRLRDAEFKTATTLAALDRLNAGVVLLDGEGGIRYANLEAGRVLDGGDGLAQRRPRAGALFRIMADLPDIQAALDRALLSALAVDVLEVPHFSTTTEVPRPSGRRPLVLQFAPLPARNSFALDLGSVSAIAFLIEPDRPASVDPGVLKKLFDITAAEARLAQRLASGDALQTAAANARVSETTARSQLAALFAKTRTHRQAELVRLLLSLGSTKR